MRFYHPEVQLTGSQIRGKAAPVVTTGASPENAEYMKAKAMRRLLDEAEKGWKSAEKDGWVSEEDAYRTLGVTE